MEHEHARAGMEPGRFTSALTHILVFMGEARPLRVVMQDWQEASGITKSLSSPPFEDLREE